jgi:tyrosyl-tRNA synthetase
LDNETILYNTAKITEQVKKILKYSQEDILQVVNNYDWFKEINLLDFLRDIGKYFSVNNMLSKDSVKSRIENNDE